MSTSRDWSKLPVSKAGNRPESERKLREVYQCLSLWQGTHHFIEEMGFKRMTPVQAIAIPLVLKQRDVAVEVKAASAWQKPCVDCFTSAESCII